MASTKRESLSGWIHVALLLVITLVTYSAVTKNGYMWDDSFFIEASAGLDSFQTALARAFTPLFVDRAYVRPLPMFSLYLEALPHGRDPVISHAINLVLHLACVLLVYWLALSQLGKERRSSHRYVALIVAAMFAVHPALVEAVAWVSSRFDLMASFFMLAGLAAASAIRRQAPMVVAVALSFFLAALCKESAVVFPAVLFAFEYLRRRQAEPGIGPVRFLLEARTLWLFGSLVAAGLAYLTIRHAVLSHGFTGLDHQDIGWAERAARASSALFLYVQKTLFPWLGLSPQSTFIYSLGNWHGRYPLLIAFALAVLAATAWAIMAGRRVGWVLAAVLVSYLPVLHLVPLTIGGNLVHERFMYFPTAILFAGLPALAYELHVTTKARRLLVGGAILWIVLSVIVARSVVPLWKNELSLWEWTTRMDPLSDLAAANLIHAYLKQGRFDDMEKVYRDMLEKGMPITVETMINMGNAQQGVNNYPKALEYYERAATEHADASPTKLAPLYSNMSVAYLMVGENQKAREAISIALRKNPEHFTAIGLMLAYCEGRPVELSRFREVDLARAQDYVKRMQVLLEHRSPEALANPQADESLCPVEFLKKGAQ